MSAAVDEAGTAVEELALVGSIYKGRVTNVEPSIQAAFVDFGKPAHGFLHISDLHPRYFPESKAEPELVGRKTPRRHRPPIQNCLRRGQEVIVQVIKEGVGTKGPTLSSYISLPGRFLVMMPGMDGWSVITTLKSDPATAQIPIILVTITDTREMGMALGVFDFLSKPVDWQRLGLVMNRLRLEQRTRPVLVVEDDDATREQLERTLRKDGWPVLTAVNGRVALEVIKKEEPALVLLDLMMPEMDGFEFLAELRRQPAWRDIPVVVLTAKDLTGEERRRLNGEVERIIQKGAYDRDELLGEVRRVLGAAVERQEARGAGDAT